MVDHAVCGQLGDEVEPTIAEHLVEICRHDRAALLVAHSSSITAVVSEPVYMIGIIDVEDFESYFVHYGIPVGEMFADIGAEIIVASQDADVLEGHWPGSWTVVVKVPSAEAARELYHSERYAPFRSARQDRLAASTALAIVPGVPTAAT